MDLVTTSEHRFFGTPEGSVWTNAAFDHVFFAEYLQTFRTVKVIARVMQVREVPPNCSRADGGRVHFIRIPHYLGPWRYALSSARVRHVIRTSPIPRDAVLLRVPSHIAGLVERVLTRSGHPFGIEIVGDPYDLLSRYAVRGLARPLWRWLFTKRLRTQCLSADACAFVNVALQRRYPARRGAVCTCYSDVMLDDPAYTASPRSARTAAGPFRIVTVGTLENFCKGPDVLLEAAGECAREGLNIHIDFVGEGKYRKRLAEDAATLGIAGRVRFLGAVQGPSVVRQHLDRADLFVLPSRAEGTPRALLEAMARGLPCIGSAVGGIPELLDQALLVPPNDPRALARKISLVMSKPELRERMSAQNLLKAAEYRIALMREKRTAFLAHLANITESWLSRLRK